MTSTVIGGALAQWPIGFLSDRIGRRKTMLGATTACALLAASIVVFVNELGFVGINLLGAAWGFFAFPIYTVAVAHTNDYADPSDYVMVSSGLLLMYGVGAIIGPFAASAVMTLSDTSGLYLLTGIVHALLAVYIVQRIVRRSSAPIEDHITFADALATAHTASQVYEEEILHQAEDES
jgi:MFS family permease